MSQSGEKAYAGLARMTSVKSLIPCLLGWRGSASPISHGNNSHAIVILFRGIALP